MEVLDYLPHMDIIDSNMMDEVLDYVKQYKPEKYTCKDINGILDSESISIKDFGILLSQAGEGFLEQMAQGAKVETFTRFGNAVGLYTPLYIANYCENHCTYCGFNSLNRIQRGKLTIEEAECEMRAISATGLSEILILTGESRGSSGIEYIGEAVCAASKYFSTVGIEIYPANVDEYRYLRDCGADFVSVYQETYDITNYDKAHPKGPKRSFPYRFYAQERAILGNMRGVSFGALLGLGDFRKDAFAAGVHAYLLQKKYPHAEISFSFPRIRPYTNSLNIESGVNERQLFQAMTAFRIFMPHAGIAISTREKASFRDNIIGIAATKISAGVKVGVGGHAEEARGDEQFDISDSRSVDEIRKMIKNKGLQPVFKDYIRV